ncbi:metallophosphoesterase [Salarchaeum sp. JOR-1]|uniref:metallophosphoesterase family protein n=1 Tax=Salarchaeum sp. JOR-1 TaxID=2599399 RepID=UPI001198C44C|nr:metallophosphoesterase [Salarchaeum sp. JOR-1]QDX39630.1 metallophosphoesterase [Salarchaeum sp. JOR-1]
MLVLGDAHANEPDRRQALLAAYRASDADVALQAGDLFYYRLPIETYFIAGNNEDFDVIDALRHGRIESDRVKNARLLASDAAAVRGLRVAGLSGNYAPSRYNYARRDLRDDRRRHFVREDVEAAEELDDVDVLLTHEAPHGTPVEEEYEVGCQYIDELLDALEPDLCLVGHHHQHTESTYGPTRVVTLAPAWESYYDLAPDTLSLTRFETPDA